MPGPSTPLDAIRHLLADQATRRALTDDPAGTMARHGFDGFSDDDVRLLLDHAGDAMPVQTAAWMQRYGSDEFVEADPPADLLADSIGDISALADEPLIGDDLTDTDLPPFDGLVGTGESAPNGLDVDEEADGLDPVPLDDDAALPADIAGTLLDDDTDDISAFDAEPGDPDWDDDADDLEF